AENFFLYQNPPGAVATPVHVAVLASRCPDCGADAKWLEDEILHYCVSCGRMLRLENDAIGEHIYQYELSQPENAVHLPFWKFPFQITLQGKQYNHLKDFFPQF